ncbi:MAG: nucleoside monophosphate kinase [Candidatus Margulisiibacteriota bacterium]
MSKKLIFLGPPGSGKGTQARDIAEKLSIAHISMGDILRQAIKDRTAAGIKAQDHLKAGTLVPDDLVNEIAKEAVQNNAGGFILDGYPRTLYQAEFLSGFLSLDRVIYIDVPYEEIVKRLAGRLSCKNCGRVYHPAGNPPKESGKCDFCGSELYTRNDDKEETVIKRLEVFEKETSVLVDYYTKKGVLVKINGLGAKDEVRKMLDAAI